jgi:hypothetical protein
VQFLITISSDTHHIASATSSDFHLPMELPAHSMSVPVAGRSSTSVLQSNDTSAASQAHSPASSGSTQTPAAITPVLQQEAKRKACYEIYRMLQVCFPSIAFHFHSSHFIMHKAL